MERRERGGGGGRRKTERGRRKEIGAFWELVEFRN